MLYKQPEDVALVRRDALGMNTGDLLQGGYDKGLDRIWEFAALSNNIYDKEGKHIDTEWKELELSSIFKMHKPSFGHDIAGLKTRVLTKNNNGQVDAAIVYRGTTSLLDFYSNLNAVTRYNPFINNLYKQARRHVTPIVNYLKEDYGENIRIFATGHSLGGGLAQQAAYSSDAINHVFAFDASPVTGFGDIPKNKLKVNKKNTLIYRIHEHGEILAYLRALMKASYTIKGKPNLDPLVVEIRFNFKDYDTAVEQHGIYELARDLKKWTFNNAGGVG